MSTVSFHIANLLEKMTSNDKDFRFMATNDLMSELQKDSIKLDDDSERKVVRMLLKLLEDKNGEVQNLAVKCLGPLVAKVKEPQVETIVDTLCTNMTGDKEQLRDISSIGLKTVITELPLTSQQLANIICKKIIGKLSVAIAKQEDVTVQLEALDILGDLLSRFGGILHVYHGTLLEALLPQLNSSRQAVRKRTVVGLGHLSASCSTQHYLKMVKILIEEMRKGLETTGSPNTYIQCTATICKNSGSRFAEYLDEVIGLLRTACSSHDDDELKENTLQAFEVFVSRCPQELRSGDHLEGILALCVKLLSHDPNYNDEEGGAEFGFNEESMDTSTGEEEEDGRGDEEEAEEDEYSDDDDMSWKVRRAAAKCIEAVISSRPDLLLYVYRNVSIPLILRFREREENVRCDVFSAYRALLRATKPAVASLNEARHTGLPPSKDAFEAVQFLENQIPQLVKIVQKQLKEKNVKSRQVALQLLAELVGVLPGCLSPYLASMMNGILICLADRSSTSNVRTNTLSFLYVIMSSHPTEVIQPHVQVLLPVLLACVGDNFYKVTSEALSTLQVLIKVIRGGEGDGTEHPNSAEFTRQIYPVILHRLRATDIDQEVKETAITSMATLLAFLGGYIQEEWVNIFPIFLERLKNEITRLTAVRALNLMASSKLVDLDLRSVHAIPVLSTFLRKNQRALKLATLTLIDTLMTRYGTMEPALLESVIGELPPLLSESDLHCAQQALQLMTSLATHQPQAVERAASVCLPSIKILVRSPLMQGAALNALMSFLRALVQANIPAFNSKRLLAIFLEQEALPSPNRDLVGSPHHKQSYYSLAKCISVISVGTSINEALAVAQGFVEDLGRLNTLSDSQIVIALLSIGEIGRHVDLSGIGKLRETILQCFSHSSEEVKTAAAHAFGSVSIGNLPVFLPALLNEMKKQPKKQYLLLHALKEIISAQHGVDISMWTEDIWTALFAHAECAEEGTRNVVAECLGRLTLQDPIKFLPRLKAALQSSSNLLRTTSISAVKFTIVDQPQPIDPILKETIGDFLKSLSDSDLNVRRVALVAFNSAAHNKPALIRDLLPQLLPQLYTETQIRRELIREVEMGPFKHSVDDGLDLRKAAFECMYTLLDSCLERLDIRDFLSHVENGLRDHYDIKMLTYLMVGRLATLCPSQVVQRLGRLIEPLKNTVTLKVKANSVKQEYEKQDELKRAALRAVSALSAIPDADKHIQLMEFVAHIRNNQDLQALYDSVQSDSVTGNANDANAMIVDN